MGSLYLLDKNTWMLTDIYSCNGAEKLSKKQGKNRSFCHDPWGFDIVTFIVHALL